MQTNFFKKSKKGQGNQWTLEEMITLGFAALIFLGLILFFLKWQSALFADEDDGSKANLISLNKEIKDLLGTSHDKDYELMNYFIGEQKMLLGFGKDADGTYSVIANSAVGVGGIDYSAGPADNLNPIYKPYDCGNSACLCLYDGAPSHETSNRDQGVLRCEREGTGKNLLFSSPNIFKFGDQVRRTRYIYIEKTKNTDGSYMIYIDLIDTSDPNNEVNKRKTGIDASRQIS